MKLVIVGADRVGIRLAKQLIEQKRDVILIEKDPDKASAAANSLDCLVIQGDGTNPEILRQAGMETAQYFISVTGLDERNLIACGMVSRVFNVPNKIARVENFNFDHRDLQDRSFLGIDYIVNPKLEAARNITARIEQGAVSDIMTFKNTGYQIRTIVVGAGSIFLGRTIRESKNMLNESFILAIIMRNRRYIIPNGSTVIEENDNLYLVASEDTHDRIFDRIGKHKLAMNKVTIVGGGSIGKYVAQHLLSSNQGARSPLGRFVNLVTRTKTRYKNVVLVDKDYDTCRSLAEELPRATIINADISDEDVFEEEHLSDSDLIVSTTNSQELNIVNSIYAKSLGVKRSIALVTKASYQSIAANLGIDVPISINDIIVQSIMKYIRGNRVQSFHPISNSQIEILELKVSPESRLVNKKIKDIKLPRQSLIIYAKSGGKELLPDGEYIIRKNDVVILISRRESMEKIESIVTGQI